jgi:hypothetical protein
MDKFTKIYNEAIPTGGIKTTPKVKPATKKTGNFLSKVGKVASAITTGAQIAKGDYDLRGLEGLSATETPTPSAAATTTTPGPSAAATKPTFNYKVGDVVLVDTKKGGKKQAMITQIRPDEHVQLALRNGPTYMGKKENVVGKVQI